MPGLYLVWVTNWVGDYDLAFRYLATQVLRSVCGWFTYLPSSPEYLMSYKDVPDIFQCLSKQCGDPSKEPVQPFVSFFSGHVATMVGPVFCVKYVKSIRDNSLSPRAGLRCESRLYAWLQKIRRGVSCTKCSADRKTSCDAGALLDRYHNWMVRCYLCLEKRGATGPLLLERCPDERLRPKESARGVRSLHGLDDRDEE